MTLHLILRGALLFFLLFVVTFAVITAQGKLTSRIARLGLWSLAYVLFIALGVFLL